MSEDQKPNLDYSLLHRVFKEVGKRHENLATLRGEYMARCKTERDQISDWLDRAQEGGFDRKAIKHELKRIELENRLDAHDADAEEDIVETADEIREKLGAFADSPLGGAAVAAAPAEKPKRERKPKPGEPDMSAANKAEALGVGDDDEDLRSKRQVEKEKLRLENEERLAGIKPLADPAATTH